MHLLRSRLLWVGGLIALVGASPALAMAAGLSSQMQWTSGLGATAAVWVLLGVGWGLHRSSARANELELCRTRGEVQSLRAKLSDSERLISLGMLTAGVVHEVNNPLAFVGSNLRFAIEELRRRPDGNTESASLEDVIQALTDANRGVQQVADVARELKCLSRSDESSEHLVDVRAVLDFAATMATRHQRQSCRLVKEYGPVACVRAPLGRLNQVFLNLILNAVQALEGPSEGQQITLVTFNDTQGHVVVEVRDTGCGISSEQRAKVFEPFFTTKPTGEGTGLGLALVQDIVTSLKGRIELESEVGKGTVFRVRFPSAAAPS